MFTNQCFTGDKDAINGEMVQICGSIFQPKSDISKNPSVTRCSIWCRLLNSFQNFENQNSPSKMDFGNVIKNCYIMQKFSDFNLLSSLDEVSASTAEISWLYLQWFRRKMNLKYSVSTLTISIYYFQ